MHTYGHEPLSTLDESVLLMPESFDVFPHLLKQDAHTTHTISDTVRETTKRLPLEDVARGMPGSTAANTAKTVHDKWCKELGDWHTHAERHAKALEDAADRYQHADIIGMQEFRRAEKKWQPGE